MVGAAWTMGFPSGCLGLLGGSGANKVNSQACYNLGVSVALPAKFPLPGLESSWNDLLNWVTRPPQPMHELMMSSKEQ